MFCFHHVFEPHHILAHTIYHPITPLSSYLALTSCPHAQQTCATTLLTNSPSSGCASNNATCLCAHTTSFADDLRNCLVETCQSGEEVQEASDYVNLFCVEYGEGGESPTPSVEGGGDGEGTQGGGGDEGEVEG